MNDEDPRQPRLIQEEIKHAAESVDFLDGKTISDAIEELQHIQSCYPGKNIMFKKQGIPYGEGDQELGLYELRPETEAEINERLRRQTEFDEREQLRVLTKRYGPG